MTLAEEKAALLRMVELVEGEELFRVFSGGVTHLPGADFVARDGLLFVTNFRVGVSAAGGFWTADDSRWFPAGHLISVDKSDKTADGELATVYVKFSSGDSIKLVVVDPSTADAARHLVRSCMRSALRSDLEENYNVAMSLQAEGRNAESLALLDALDKRMPASIPVQLARMYTSLALGDAASAVQIGKRAINLGGLYLNQDRIAFAQVAIQCGAFDEAERAAHDSYVSKPSCEALLLRSQARYHGGDKAAAVLDAERAASTYPDALDTWLWLAEVGADVSDSVVLQRCVVAFERLGDSESALVYGAFLCLCRGEAQEAYSRSYSALSGGIHHVQLARVFVRAASDMKVAVDDEQLKFLDAIAKDDFHYELHVVVLLLQMERTADALGRVDVELWRAIPGASPILALLVAADSIKRQDWFGARDALATVVNDDAPTWLNSEDDQSLWTELNIVAGWAELELGAFGRAASFLRRAEAGTVADTVWIRDALPALCAKANAESAIASVSASDYVPQTYEVLTRLHEVVGRSTRLASLTSKVQRMVDEFDEAPVVAVMGEYSVGKSSFINALVRRPLLPTGEGVTTGTITVLRFGLPERMRAVFADGRVVERDQLTSVAEFVQETGRGSVVGDLPHHVDVFLDSDVLRSTTVVDTPGLNAPFPEHKRITELYLDQADAIIWLFNVETAGRSTERDFLAKLSGHSRKTIGVVNQIDLVPRDEVLEVMESLTQDFPGAFASVHPVSAKHALDGIRRGDDSLFERSGMVELSSWLEGNILSAARPIKESGTRDRVRMLFEDVRKLREDFDNVAGAQLAELRGERERLVRWVDDGLAMDLANRFALARASLEEAIAELALASASGGRTAQQCDALVRAFLVRVREVWSSDVAHTLRLYDEQVQGIERLLAGLAAPEWQGVLDASRRALVMSFASWRKDLKDYSEHLTAYVDGFVDAGGLAGLVLHCPSSRTPEDHRVKLRERLTFLWERPQLAYSRWGSELRGNIREELQRLERDMRADVAHVRESSFREVERLAALVPA